MTDTKAQLLTVGHGTAGQAGFAELLATAGVQSLVDVRISPGSRKFPHFGKDQLAEWLPAAGVLYRWEKRLGGFPEANLSTTSCPLTRDPRPGWGSRGYPS